ncbi:hypothetical protein K461DRAFT_295444 [Myriangium duriaei CBS 260.36]|uniref:Uncharacterized protein n=1 Tax=Myriangium duriaei CBS 260.36 TaxID=1168546 RepID=A0A9P4IYP7_9PEZI|nr:hypothetical protein K461DRAFT_295444 [Myriangium duriaei CBS 260.36]
MSKPAGDAEVIFNRANVVLARSQKVIESWLGPPAADKSSGGNLWEQTEEDESDFKPEPEGLGVGAEAPNSNDIGIALKRKTTASTDRLLEQLIGKNAAKQHQAKNAVNRTSARHGATKPLKNNEAAKQPQPIDDDSDESEGRAAMFKSKSSRKRGRAANAKLSGESLDKPASQVVSDDDGDDGGKSGQGPAKRRATASSYLDQVLAAKGSKKKTKQNL